MNDRKIAIILCVNDEGLYTESLKYISSLIVPDGFELDVIAITEASSITSAYNSAMNSSDAKYKIYMHQDTFIINKNIICDILDIFRKNLNLGLLGMVGAAQLPTSGIWWEAQQIYGKVYESHMGRMELLSFQEIHSKYMNVTAIDGFVMVTQYDLPWRDDLFNGWHFYDLSQSIEFIKAGYEVGVPRQEQPWFIHDCGIVNVSNGYDENRKLFLEEYSKDIFPLVSVLIPAYNRPYFLSLALNSVLDQTYQNIEIIISDDSTNDDVWNMLQPYLTRHSHIRYIKNEQDKWGGNFHNLYLHASGKYINYLNDDDLFHETKIEKMVNYLEGYPNIRLATSSRNVIDEVGRLCTPIASTQILFKEDTIISGKALGDIVLSNCLNVIGEVSTVMFRREDLKEKLGYYHGKSSIMGDLSSWLSLLAKGDAIYIVEPLSSFRMHQEQMGMSLNKTIVPAINDWLQIIIDARKDDFLSKDKDYKKALIRYLRQSIDYIDLAYEDNSEDLLIKHDVYKSCEYAFSSLTKKLEQEQ